MTLQNVLIASDFSKHANWALQRALEIAKQNHTQIHFLHVVTPPLNSIAQSAETELHANHFAEKQAIEELILKQLQGANQQLIAYTSLVLGRISDEVVRYVDDNQCELIVVGAHGTYYINDYVLGTASGSIIRQSHVPVLLIKKEPNFTYQRILIATDRSAASKEAIEFAAACFPNATFQLLHIVDVYYRQFLSSNEHAQEHTDSKHPKIQTIMDKLDVFLSTCRVDKDKFERKIIGGYSADAIVEHANQWHTDLLVFGTQGRSSLHYLLMGSVAKRILHLSTVDMLTVPPKIKS